jgi:site-specific recombinase XerD
MQRGKRLMDKDESLLKFEQYWLRRSPGRRTSKDYLSDIRQFTAFCQKEWREVNKHDIEAFVDNQRARKLKATTINRRVAALKTFFDFLAEESDDLSWPNPVNFKRHASKRGKQLPRDLRDEDLEQVWAEISSPRDRAWFALMVRGGLRVGEVVGLSLEDLLAEPEGEHPARLRVLGKGRKERIAFLTADAYDFLDVWLAERPETAVRQIFLNERGNPLQANGIEWLLHRYGKQAGIDLTPHQLRHTFARQATEAGMPVTSLGKLLGHAQIATTQIYTAGADPALAKAYQEAMQRLQTALRRPPSPPQVDQPVPTEPEPELPPLLSALKPPSELLEPDWEAWGQHFPADVRQASIDYVKRRYPNWAAQNRRTRAMKYLQELRGMWEWFLAQRPFSHPGELGLKDLWAYQTDQVAQDHTAGTINRRTDYILGVIRDLAERDVPVDNSVFRLRYLRRPDSLPRHLTEAESQRLEGCLLEKLPHPKLHVRMEAACILLMLHSGLRSGECVNLRGQDLDLPGKRLIVRQGKGQRDRVVYLSDLACRAIHAYLQDTTRLASDPLWLKSNGQPMSQGWLSDHVAAVGKAIGVENLFPHRLRHTCATRLLNAGMDITRIQSLLGHEKISTTMIYARVHDQTVEADYRRALQQIELHQMPFSDQPIAVQEWPTQVVNVLDNLDNSV